MAHEHQSNSAVCRCGETTIELTGDPIQSVICYCESCRTAGHEFERDLGAPQTVNADGGELLRFADVPGLHPRPLADDFPGSLVGASARAADAHYDQGQTRRFGAVERHPRLRYAAASFHDQATRRLGGDGVPPSEVRLVMAPKAKIAVENVNKPGRTVSVDADKYLAMKAAMLAVLPASAPGLTLAGSPALA